MSILVNKNSRIITQGMTGKTGQFHTRLCRDYGFGKECFVGGVNPKKAGQVWEGLPIFGSVKEAKEKTGSKSLLLGPNCPGIMTPGEVNVGIMPAHIHRKGRIGVVSRSGTLTYEAVAQITDLGLGQSTAIGIGGDPINGLKHIDVLKLFNNDPETDAVVMIGEIGGSDEETAAEWVKNNMKKPVVGFIAGVTAPAGKRMGHAGAIISGGTGTAEGKLAVMEACGIRTTRNPSEIGSLLQSVLSSKKE